MKKKRNIESLPNKSFARMISDYCKNKSNLSSENRKMVESFLKSVENE